MKNDKIASEKWLIHLNFSCLCVFTVRSCDIASRVMSSLLMSECHAELVCTELVSGFQNLVIVFKIPKFRTQFGRMRQPTVLD